MRHLDAIVRYIVHLRVPVLGALALLFLPWAMRGRSLFANLFELTTAGVFTVGVAAGLAGWTCVMTALLVLRLAPARYHLPELRWVALDENGAPRHRGLELFVALVVGGTGLAVAGIREHADPQPWSIAQVLTLFGGVASGLAVVRLVERLVVQRLVRRRVQVDPPAQPAAPAHRPEAWWRAGYFVPDSFRVLQGHLPALAGLFVLLGVYAWMATRAPEHVDTPVLAMLVFALALLVSALTGISFFCDRFGLPLLLVLVVWTTLGGLFSRSTHVFHARRSAKITPTSIAAALDARRPDDRRVIVVCAEGGGIQAAAWTAEVLVQLDAALPEFHRRLGLVSAVSGGSVGAMHYLARFDPSGPLTPDARNEVRAAAAASSLIEVGWALVFKDLRRVLGMRWLIDARMDRSLALEATWRRHLGDQQSATLGSWTAKTSAGLLPPMVFNATLAGVGPRPNKGKRLMFSSVDFGTTAPPREERLHSFFAYFGSHDPGPATADYDIDIVTAARMSATFPYVTPLARAADADSSALLAHTDYLADGGYFDNSGIATAMDWLLQALAHDPALHVAVVLVRSFPESLADQVDPRLGPWANAALGPLDLMLATRSSTQAVRADIEAQLVEVGGRVQVFTMQFDTDRRIAPPLSWHLSRAQAEQIGAAWTFAGKRPAPATVASELEKWSAGQ